MSLQTYFKIKYFNSTVIHVWTLCKFSQDKSNDWIVCVFKTTVVLNKFKRDDFVSEIMCGYLLNNKSVYFVLVFFVKHYFCPIHCWCNLVVMLTNYSQMFYLFV